MVGALVGIGLGILSGVVTVLLLQLWPPRYRWSEEISWTVGEPSGLAIHQVKIGRRRRRVWKRRPSHIDVTLRARLAVQGIGHKPRAVKVVDIPVDKSWRPVLGQTVLVKLLPEECLARELRYFPDEVRRKRADGTLRLDDLLAVGKAELRVFAFAYRPHVGTRWMRRGTYRADAIRPGVFEGMRIVPPADGLPPGRPDFSAAIAPAADQAPTVVLRLGRWSVQRS